MKIELDDNTSVSSVLITVILSFTCIACVAFCSCHKTEETIQKKISASFVEKSQIGSSIIHGEKP